MVVTRAVPQAALDNAALVDQIGTLMSAGLISEETPGQYAFRHALIREAVYSNLLIKDRKRFHRAIGETIATLYHDAPDDHLADLSLHFHEAGEWNQALEYARAAGERARAMYAPREAIEHLSRALDAGRRLGAPGLSLLFRERGHAYELLGDFELARSDYESALAEAHSSVNRGDEWEALIGLGFLWASRDYDQTGEYFKQALALARTIDDRGILGHSLNRVGNWCLNVGVPDRALRYHQEGMRLFQELGDTRGIAETADLLGLTNGVMGNWRDSSAAFEHAVKLFRSINDRRGLSSALANRALRGVFLINDLYIPSDEEYPKIFAEIEEALALAREIDWRAGEAYALAILGSLFGSSGDVDRGLGLLLHSLQLSQEIGHSQWALFSHMAMGGIYFGILELDRAQAHFETALAAAQEIRSTNFANPLAGRLAQVLIEKGGRASLKRAKELLHTASSEHSLSSSFAQHPVDIAGIEWAFARGEHSQALDVIDRWLALLAERAPWAVAAQLRLYKAQALAALHRTAEAESVLEGLIPLLPRKWTRPFLWRVHVELGHLYRRRRRHSKSREQFEEACRIIDELAAKIHDPILKDRFSERARSQIPQGCRVASSANPPDARVHKPVRGKTRPRRKTSATRS